VWVWVYLGLGVPGWVCMRVRCGGWTVPCPTLLRASLHSRSPRSGLCNSVAVASVHYAVGVGCHPGGGGWGLCDSRTIKQASACVVAYGCDSLPDLKAAIKGLFTNPDFAGCNCRPFAFRVRDDEEVCLCLCSSAG
jgi:hypothetical protein